MRRNRITLAIVALEPAKHGIVRGAIGIPFTTADANQAPTKLPTAGVNTDDILTWHRVPPMFAFRGTDGNAYSITEAEGRRDLRSIPDSPLEVACCLVQPLPSSGSRWHR